MNKKNHHKLDNPVWYSLSETHQQFSVDYKIAKFYHPDYCPFGGFETTDNISSQIDDYSTLVDNFYVVGNKPSISDRLAVHKELVCLQMIINNKIDIEQKEEIVLLTNEYADALFQVVNLVQPGYFKVKTALLGN